MYRDKEKQKEAWKRARHKYYHKDKDMTLNKEGITKRYDNNIESKSEGMTQLPFSKNRQSYYKKVKLT